MNDYNDFTQNQVYIQERKSQRWTLVWNGSWLFYFLPKQTVLRITLSQNLEIKIALEPPRNSANILPPNLSLGLQQEKSNSKMLALLLNLAQGQAILFLIS